MSARSDYLLRLSVTCQLADERSRAYPDDCFARRYAEAVRMLFLDAIGKPEGHALFERTVDGRLVEHAPPD